MAASPSGERGFRFSHALSKLHGTACFSAVTFESGSFDIRRVTLSSARGECLYAHIKAAREAAPQKTPAARRTSGDAPGVALAYSLLNPRTAHYGQDAPLGYTWTPNSPTI